MQITFISTERAIITVLFLALSLCIYFWKVRPFLKARPEFHDFYYLADTLWTRVWEWVKIRWGIVWAAVLAATPIVWNGGLDTIIAVSRMASDGTLDLSWLVMAPWLKTVIQLTSVTLPIIQAAVMTKPKAD